jgi:hypothetical protein
VLHTGEMRSPTWDLRSGSQKMPSVRGAVAELVGNEGGVVSGVINLESSGVSAPEWRPRHDEHYHEAGFFAACSRDGC